MLATTGSYEYWGFQIRIDCYRQPMEDTWSATYRITCRTDGAVVTNGAVAGGYLSSEEAEAGAKKAANFWIDRQEQVQSHGHSTARGISLRVDQLRELLKLLEGRDREAA